MKKTITYTLLAFSYFFTSAQSHSNFLDAGNIKALVNSNGLLFHDTSISRGAFEAPKGSAKHSIYSSGIWMSALSQRNGLPHFTYGYEYVPYLNHIKTGPVNIVNQIPDTSAQFQRLWKVNKVDIDQHKQNWNTGNYVIPASIADWPGNGNGNTAKNLAPYADLDNDSIYEPQDGEYPIIKGDQAIFLMANNFKSSIDSSYVLRPRVDSSGMIIGTDTFPPQGTSGYTQLEIHLLLYSYTNQSPEVKNTVFANVKLFNRAATNDGNLENFRFSVYSDFDLGNSIDDYIGTDTARNMFYGYNGDNFDEGTFGYGNNLAAQGILFLDKEINSTIYFTTTFVDWTQNPAQVRNLQQGIWQNGRQMYYGADGFSGCVDTNRVTKFVFSGDPTFQNDSSQWTEINPCFGDTTKRRPPGDRMMVGSPDLPLSINHGTSIEFNYAYVFAQDSTGNIASISKLKETADTVQNFFDRNRFVGIKKVNTARVEFTISPNPSNDKITLNTGETNFELTVFDVRGAKQGTYKNTRTLNVSELARGIYFLQIKTQHGTGVKKLIVTN